MDENTCYVLSLLAATSLSSLCPWLETRTRWLKIGVLNGAGAVLLVLFCRWHILYILAGAFLTLVSLQLGLPRLSIYIISFGILFFARASFLFGLPPLTGLSNVCLLLATLRLIDFAIFVRAEQQESPGKAQPPEGKEGHYSVKNREHFSGFKVFILLLLHLTFLPGIWSGPLVQPEYSLGCLLSFPANDTKQKNVQTKVALSYTIERFLEVSFHIVYYVIYNFVVMPRFPNTMDVQLNNATQELYPVVALSWHLAKPLLALGPIIHAVCRALVTYGLLVAYLINFRARFLIAWLLSEIALVFSGVRKSRVISCSQASEAISPKGPWVVAQGNFSGTVEEIKTRETQIIRNFDMKKVEFALSLRDVLMNWNTTIQSWLVRCVYKQYRPSNQWKRRLAVVAVSAFWHGLHPGYYIAFLSLPMVQYCSSSTFDLLEEIVAPNKKGMLTGLRWITTQTLLSFFVIPFVCLSIKSTLDVWSLLSFYGFIECTILWSIKTFYKKTKGPSSGEQRCKDTNR